jgi:hypothetical protein
MLPDINGLAARRGRRATGLDWYFNTECAPGKDSVGDPELPLNEKAAGFSGRNEQMPL